jgi:hypothetical protein
MTMLPEPGFWVIDESDYHSDPAPEPSLSNSVGQILLDECPRKAWFNHPRLNPNFRPQEATTPERGTVAHTLLLGRGAAFSVIEADDYRTKAAQMERDALRAAGRVPILHKHHEVASAMAIAARKQLKDIEGGEFAFNPEWGDLELCALSRDPVGCWTRSLIDFYGAKIPSGVVCWDYKTTAANVNPTALGAKMDDGWAFQAAFQERVIVTLKPELAGRIKFKFLVQENVEPYLCSVVEPTSAARTIAHKKVAAAVAIWKACLERGAWPGYARTATAIGGAAWKEAAWLSRELDDELVQLAARDPFLTQVFGTPAPYVSYNAALAGADTNVYTPRPKRGPYKPARPDDRRRKANKLPPGTTVMDAG